MKCQPEILKTKQVTNSDVAYRIVCCGEACCHAGGCDKRGDHVCCHPSAHTCEDTWLTLHLDVNHDAKLDEYKSVVAARHEKMKAWRGKR